MSKKSTEEEEDEEEKGYLIRSLYNPDIIMFDGTKSSRSVCDQFDYMIRSAHKEKIKLDLALAEERAKFSQSLSGNLRKFKIEAKRIRILRNRVNHFQAKNQRLLHRIRMYKKELRASNESLENLRGEVDSHFQQTLEFADKLQDMKKEVQTWREDFTVLQNRCYEERMEMEDTILECKDEITGLEDQNEELESEKKNLEEKVADLERQVLSWREDYQVLEDGAAQERIDNENATIEAGEFSAKCEVLETQKEELEEKVAALEEQVAFFESRIELMNEQDNEKVAALASQNLVLGEQVALMESQIDEMKEQENEQVVALERQILSLNEILSEHDNDHEMAEPNDNSDNSESFSSEDTADKEDGCIIS